MTATPNVHPDFDRTYDGTYRHLLTDTEDAHVAYDTEVNADGSLISIIRTVTRKANRRRDQHILWQETVAVLPRAIAASLISDLAGSLAV